MILIVGPLFSGKHSFAMENFGLQEDDFSCCFPCRQRAIAQAQALPGPDADPDVLIQLADALAQKEVVLCTEIGGGVVPIDPAQRAERENAGRLTLLLAKRAHTVVRLWCGLPQVLKGSLPPRPTP